MEYPDSLKTVLTYDDPLGPIDADKIPPDLTYYIYSGHSVLTRILKRNPKYIYGRRGSGKTSYLQLASSRGHYQYTIPLELNELLTSLHGLDYPDVMYVENVAHFWNDLIYLIACKYYSTLEGSDSYVRDFVAKFESNIPNGIISRYSNSSVPINGILWNIIDILKDSQGNALLATIPKLIYKYTGISLSECKQRLFNHLRTTNKSIAVLIDSIDEYNYGDFISDRLLGGLFKFIGRHHNNPLFITLALPLEHKSIHDNVSTNPTKDFSQCQTIEWRTTELLSIVATRLYLFLRLYYKDHRFAIQDDVSTLYTREGAVRFLNNILPTEITNFNGYLENTIGYILRHTHLLPRHVLLLLNAIFSNAIYSTADLTLHSINGELIKSSISKIEPILAKEIMRAFRPIYKNVYDALGRVLPQLGPAFTIGELHRQFNQGAKAVCDLQTVPDVHEFLKMLLSMGVVGVVTNPDHVTKYILAEFYYTLPDIEDKGRQNEVFVLHPLFSSLFSRRQGKPVYPSALSYTIENR